MKPKRSLGGGACPQRSKERNKPRYRQPNGKVMPTCLENAAILTTQPIAGILRLRIDLGALVDFHEEGKRKKTRANDRDA